MDKITVAELATECSVQNQVVLSELKRLGLIVFSPTATIDISFAETIRKKILSQREAEHRKLEEAEREAEHRKREEVERRAKAAESRTLGMEDPATDCRQPALMQRTKVITYKELGDFYNALLTLLRRVEGGRTSQREELCPRLRRLEEEGLIPFRRVEGPIAKSKLLHIVYPWS